MADPNDSFLLREFAERQSESAFSDLVQRHLNFVYSVAMRYVGNPADAQDVAQAVFLILARKSARLCGRATLTGWLYETTRLTARQLLRTRKRRLAREQEAYMQSTLNTTSGDPLWHQLAPHLEEAMSRLRAADRELLALRFYENKTGEEAAALLGIGAAAAHKRTNRALEKLRVFFSKRGVHSTTAVIASTISGNSIQIAPAGLAKIVSTVALAKGAAASTSTLTLLKGALKIMAWTKMQTALVIGAVAVLSISTVPLVIKLKPQTTFPRSSWKYVGLSDPKSAMMSYFWAENCQTNRKTYEDTLTPAQKRIYAQVIAMDMKVPQPLSEEATVAEEFKRNSDVSQNASYRILQGPVISGSRALMQIEVAVAGTTVDAQVRFKRIGNEWRFDGIENRKIANANQKP